MIATQATTRQNASWRNADYRTERRLAIRFRDRCRPRRIRSMESFACDEIIHPTGPAKGRRYRPERQPFSGMLVREFDSGRWSRFAVTGTVQSGKTTTAALIPMMYHLFEMREDVIFGVPKKKLAFFKWEKDIKPIIERSRFRDEIPTRGQGSQGGNKFESITFRCGASLIFMSGSGSDEERSSITSRVLVATEVDKYDEAGEVSQETDPVNQLISRTDAFGDDARIYLECTVSDEKGKIWTEYNAGSASRIVVECVFCGEFVEPGRSDCHGWEDAPNEIAASASASFACPHCQTAWNDDQRRQMNEDAVLLHRDQTIVCGEIKGDQPQTRTLGFKWNAFNNLFWNTSKIGREEWNAVRSNDPESSELRLKQFYWTIPAELSAFERQPLTVDGIMSRKDSSRPRGAVPSGYEYLTMGVDLGDHLFHFTVTAIKKDGTPHVVDYGMFEAPTQELGLERGLWNGLTRVFERAEQGWIQSGTGESVVPQQVWIDSGAGDHTPIVYEFIKWTLLQLGDVERYRAVKGYGIGQHEKRRYTEQQQTNLDGKNSPEVGDHFHAKWLAHAGCFLFHVDANYWKSQVHQRLRTPKEEPAALTIFDGTHREHIKFTHHLMSETEVVEMTEHGVETSWRNEHKAANHWLDSTYMSLAAGAFCGAQVIRVQPQAKPTAESEVVVVDALQMPDGRPFLEIETR